MGAPPVVAARPEATTIPKALARLKTVLAGDDPSGQLTAALGYQGAATPAAAGHGPTRYSRREATRRLIRLLSAITVAHMPETTRLATRSERWWPDIKGFLKLGVTNARAPRTTPG